MLLNSTSFDVFLRYNYLIRLMLLRIITITYLLSIIKAQFCNVLAASNGFQIFQKNCSKEYSDETEREKRKAIFQDNCKKIKDMRRDPLLFQIGSHCNSDRLNSQILPDKLPKPIGTSKSFSQRKTKKYIQTEFKVNSSSYFTNWQTLGMITSIKDQQSCGSCWAFSSTALVESIIKIYQNQEYDLSQQYTIQCTNNYAPSIYYSSSCSGGYVDFALQMQVHHGLPQENIYPYLAKYTSYGMPNFIADCDDDSVQYHKMKFQDKSAKWNRYDNITSEQIRLLLNQSPLIGLFYAEPTFINYKTGIYSCPVNFQTAYDRINHAILIVGQDESGNYIIKNSWGTTWGNQGFATINSASDCGLSAFIYSVNFLFEINTILAYLAFVIVALSFT